MIAVEGPQSNYQQQKDELLLVVLNFVGSPLEEGETLCVRLFVMRKSLLEDLLSALLLKPSATILVMKDW